MTDARGVPGDGNSRARTVPARRGWGREGPRPGALLRLCLWAVSATRLPVFSLVRWNRTSRAGWTWAFPFSPVDVWGQPGSMSFPGDSEAGTGSQQAALSPTRVPQGRECPGYLQRAALRSSHRKHRRFFSGVYCRDLTTPGGKCRDPEGPIGLGPSGLQLPGLSAPSRQPPPVQASLPSRVGRQAGVCSGGPGPLRRRGCGSARVLPPPPHRSQELQIFSLFGCPLITQSGGAT